MARQLFPAYEALLSHLTTTLFASVEVVDPGRSWQIDIPRWGLAADRLRSRLRRHDRRSGNISMACIPSLHAFAFFCID